VHLGTLTDWLRDHGLPGVLVVIGGTLLLRALRWIEHQYEADIDARIRTAVDRDDVASERLKRSRAVLRAVGWATSVTVTIASASLAIHVMGVPLATLVAPATVIGVAVGFGAQQVVGDLLAGFFMLAEHQFGYGDVIRYAAPGDVGGVTGTVEELTLRVTKLRTTQGELVTIPNSAIRQVTNLSKEWSRAVVDLPIAIDEDIDRASAVLRAAADVMATEADWAGLLLGAIVVTGIESFEIGYVRVRIVARTLPGRQFEVARELRRRLAAALTDAGVATMTVDGGAS
jgi:small-conductance mechanosensitive channel